MFEALDWLMDKLTELVVTVYEWLLNGLVSLLSLLPLPEFFDDVEPVVIPPEIGYFIGIAQIDFALSVIVSAYIARFILRRVPFIG